MTRRGFLGRVFGGIATALASPCLLAATSAPVDEGMLRMTISDTPEYAFGFTGFKEATDLDQITGQIRYLCNIQVASDRVPRLQRTIHGISE